MIKKYPERAATNEPRPCIENTKAVNLPREVVSADSEVIVADKGYSPPFFIEKFSIRFKIERKKKVDHQFQILIRIWKNKEKHK